MDGCPITVPSSDPNEYRKGFHQPSKKCGKPLAPESKFCEKHEADRIRLMNPQER